MMATDSITYNSAHRRIRRVRDSAKFHLCVDCKDPARDWTYQGDCKDEATETTGNTTLKYCPHPKHYEPRCRSCHLSFDEVHPAPPPSPFNHLTPRDRLRNEKRRFAAQHLWEAECALCFEDDSLALVHTVPKGEDSIAVLASKNVSWTEFNEAVHKATVLCLNCRAKVGGLE